MLHTSIESFNLGGYECYFKPTLYVIFGLGYNVNLIKYRGWAERIMTLACIPQIRSAFHPEDGKSTIGDKCNELKELIRSVSDAEKNQDF